MSCDSQAVEGRRDRLLNDLDSDRYDVISSTEVRVVKMEFSTRPKRRRRPDAR